MATFFQNSIALIGRILLSLIFIASGLGHILDWTGTVKYMTAQGMTMENMFGAAGQFGMHVLLAFAVTFLLLGGLSILLGFRARLGAVLLIAFMIPTTLIFHNFWIHEPGTMDYKMQMINFMKNSGLLGGILLVLAFGAGRFSIDYLLSKRRVELKG